MHTAESSLRDYLDRGAGKLTRQSKLIFDVIVEADAHFTIEELYNRTKQRHPRIGMATVYRTVKLLCDCGLASGFRHTTAPSVTNSGRSATTI